MRTRAKKKMLQKQPRPARECVNRHVLSCGLMEWRFESFMKKIMNHPQHLIQEMCAG